MAGILKSGSQGKRFRFPTSLYYPTCRIILCLAAAQTSGLSYMNLSYIQLIRYFYIYLERDVLQMYQSWANQQAVDAAREGDLNGQSLNDQLRDALSPEFDALRRKPEALSSCQKRLSVRHHVWED